MYLLFLCVICISPLWRVITYKQLYPDSINILFSHFSFFNYFDSLAIGCGAAVLFSQYRSAVHDFLNSHITIAFITGVMLMVLPYSFPTLHIPESVNLLCGRTMQSLGFILLLIASITKPNALAFRWLNWSFVRWIGVLSYSLYIWQQLFCSSLETFGLKQEVWWLSFPGWLLAVFVVATISYYGLERPLLKIRARFRTPSYK